MNEILTTNERLTKIEVGINDKLDKALAFLNPAKAEKAENAELFEKFDLFKEEIRNILTGLGTTNTTAKATEDEFPEDTQFTKKAWSFVSIGFIASSVATLLSYKLALFLFSFCFSFVFGFAALAFGLAADYFLIPGNSIGRMAKNAIAIAIFWAVFTGSIVVGFSIGNSIISDPFGGEERSSKQVQERYIETTAPRPDGDTLRLGEGTTQSEQ